MMSYEASVCFNLSVLFYYLFDHIYVYFDMFAVWLQTKLALGDYKANHYQHHHQTSIVF